MRVLGHLFLHFLFVLRAQLADFVRVTAPSGTIVALKKLVLSMNGKAINGTLKIGLDARYA